MKDPNEKRVLIATALCVAVFAVWQYVQPPAPPEPEAPVASSTTKGPAPTAPGATTTLSPAATPSTGPCVAATEMLSTGGNTATGDGVQFAVDACGRAISSVSFPGWPQAVEVTPWWTWLMGKVSGEPGGWVSYNQGSGQERLLSDKGGFALVGFGPRTFDGAWTLSRVGTGVQAQTTRADGLTITQVLTPGEDPWAYDLAVTYTATQGTVTGSAWVGVADAFADADGSYDTHPHLAAVVDDDLEQQLKPSEIVEPESLEGPVSWLGVEDRYFLAAIQPADATWGHVQWERLADSRVGAFLVKDAVTVTPGAPVQFSAKVYAGKKDVERLAAVGNGLEQAADLGMFGFFSKILLFFLGIFNGLSKNVGFAILLLTLFVRVVFYPLTASAFKSGKVMQALQPKIKALQERHGEDKETLNREMLKLFAKHNANPLGGCLPMLVQMPVFFALYSGLMHSPELYHANFLFVRDLSAPDPYGVFPGLMAVGMVLQQRLTPMTGMDPDQARMMKVMPLVFALFMFSVPAGLSVYYATNTLLSIAQQWYNTRTFQVPNLDEEA